MRTWRVRFLMTELPQPGDVVIRKISQSPECYVLSQYPGGPQFSYETYDVALARGSAFAARDHVDVWYAQDAAPFVRVAQHRVP